jgi:hypothetical protein
MKPCKASANKASAALRKVYANVFMSEPDKRPAERKTRGPAERIALWQCSTTWTGRDRAGTDARHLRATSPFGSFLPVVKNFFLSLNQG